MKTLPYAGVLALAISLSSCGKSASDDPRALVLSLVTGIALGAENVTGAVGTMQGDWSIKAGSGDGYSVQLERKSPGLPPHSVTVSVASGDDRCKFKADIKMDERSVPLDLDFSKFGGISVMEGNLSMLNFHECGYNAQGQCVGLAPILWADKTDAQKKTLKSYAQKMREEICKQS